ncbi:MAG: tetratricopeptide repeat protein [Gammaproteobacteria bacterium]
MSRKRTRARKGRLAQEARHTDFPLEALEQKAQAELAAGHHREAIGCYKDLLKREPRSQWVAELARAYQGRAAALSTKGMVKEALIIWQNRSEFCSRPLAEPFFFHLLLRNHQVQEAIVLLREHHAWLEQHDHLPELRQEFAAQTLAGHTEIISGLAPDDPVVKDYPLASAALDAYARGDDLGLAQQLKQISYRSPYRDLGRILKALCQMDTDPEQAGSLLERIAETSPFTGLASAAGAASRTGPALFRELRRLDKEARCFIAALQGWSAQQLEAVQELFRLGEQPGPDALLRFLVRHRTLLGEAYVRQTGLKLLVKQPRLGVEFARAFGAPSTFDLARIEALRDERDPDPTMTYASWLDALEALEDAGACQGTEEGLCAALLLRRMAEHCQGDDSMQVEITQALERSLNYDPDKPQTYLQLISHYRQGGQLKDARRLVDQALGRYPDDIHVLTAGVEAAVAGEAFKKAAGLAQRILDLDPINPKVRDLLLGCHLKHARKQLKKGQLELARKELDEALRWAQSARAQGRVEILRGMLESMAGEEQAAGACFRDANKHLGGGLLGPLHVLLEAGHLGQPMARVLKKAKLPNAQKSLTRESVLALMNELNALVEEDRALLRSTLDCLHSPLQRAADLDLTRAEMELACEVLRRLQHDELRERFAERALARWPDTPVFVYHRIDAGCSGWYMGLPPQKIQELEAALERARADGDERTAHRIGRLLDLSPFIAPKGRPHAGDLEDKLGGLVDMLGVERTMELLLNSGDSAVAEILKTALGPQGLRRLLEAHARGEPIAIAQALSGVSGGLDEAAPVPVGRRSEDRRGAKRHPDRNQLELF